jgi:hypothetical protein
VKTAWCTCLFLGAVALGCTSDLDTTRVAPPRGTLGREIFTVLCDRVGANALREDVLGASYHAVCHADANGTFADSVDQSQLVALDPSTTDVNGNPVPMDVQIAARGYHVARIEALARDRDKLIAAFDASFPSVTIPIKDTSNLDPTQSCNPAGTGPLQHELADILGKMSDLSNDRTVPLFTESLAQVLDDVQAEPDAQQVLTRFDARQGYRPNDVAMGIARPALSYPRLVPLTDAFLRLIATDSDPYNPAGVINGVRTPIPGQASPQFQQLLTVMREELRTEPTPTPLAPLVAAADPSVPEWQWLSRPRTSLEFARQVLLSEDASFDDGLGSATTRYIVSRDPRGVASVPLVNGKVPPPFVDSTGDGLPDLDPLGQFVTTNQQPVPSPFYSVDGVDGPRDSAGRAVATAQGAPLYGNVDTRQTYLAQLERDLKPLLNPDPNANHETVMKLLAGLPVLFGTRDATAISTKTYAPDPSRVADWLLAHDSPPPADLASQPVTVPYAAYHPESSPLVDLVYALGVMLQDPATDDLLQLGRRMMAEHPNEMARLIGIGLQVKAIADKHPEAHIPQNSTFWDEMLDVFAEVAHVQDNVDNGGVLEDLILAFANNSTVKLQDTFGAYTQFCDQLTYDHRSTDCSTYTDTSKCLLNGPPFNLSSQDNQPLHTACDRTQPDVGTNRSALQMFIQSLHDGKGASACTKEGAIAHIVLNLSPIPGLNLGTVNIDYPTNSLVPIVCAFAGAPTPTIPMPQCGILRIKDVDALLLDVALNRAQFDVRDPCLQALTNSSLTGLVGGADAFLQQQAGIVGFDTHPTVQGVSRLFYFEIPDNGNPGDQNPATTQTYNFLSGIIDPPQTAACQPTPFTDTDGTVLNLYDCTATPQYDLRHRNPGATFPLEQFNFVQNITPLAIAFDDHGATAQFVDLFNTLHLHWGSNQQTPDICDPTLPKSNARWCSQDGLVSYEPLLVDVLRNTDTFQALHDTLPILQGTTVDHCIAQDPKTFACTQSVKRTGVQVLADVARKLVDPARNVGLTDRFGHQAVARNDGSQNPQVTPIYLFIDALKGIDAAFAAWAQAHPTDATRQDQWHQARSDLVDQFFSVTGTGTQTTWANPSVPKILPILSDVLLAQIHAHCPDRTTGSACPWALQDLVQNVSDVVSGPTFAAVMDLLDALRQNDAARGELEQLLQYLLDNASSNAAQQSMLSSTVDMLQSLGDDTDLAPFYRAAADAMSAALVADDPTKPNAAPGGVVKRGFADAAVELLARVFSAAHDAANNEICAEEFDPNQAIPVVLKNMVTPMGDGQLSPVEVMIDAIADVNRAQPQDTSKLAPADYANMAKELSEFMLDPASGLEQVYLVVREATQPE